MIGGKISMTIILTNLLREIDLVMNPSKALTILVYEDDDHILLKS